MSVTSLADRVLKNMILVKLGTVISVMVAAGTTPAGRSGPIRPARGGLAEVRRQTRPVPRDVAGRIVDDAGHGVANGHVWAVVGSWGERTSIATGETDGQGRFVLPKAWDHDATKGVDQLQGDFGLCAGSPDGRIGWLDKVDRRAAGEEQHAGNRRCRRW